ncbi:hypothetical protein LINPERPRIM_LOCUS30813 [Linum perenne]
MMKHQQHLNGCSVHSKSV